MMFWICLGCLLVGVAGVAFFWAVEHGHVALRRAQAHSLDWKPNRGWVPAIETLGSLSAFDDYMAEWQVS
jgi:hypothetical protein